MPCFAVISKATGQEAYRYKADEPHEFLGFEFSDFEHIELVEAPQLPGEPMPTPRFVTKLQFLDRLGDEALQAILALAKTDVGAEAFITRFQSTSVREDGLSIDLADQRTVHGVTTLGALLEAAGKVPPGWAEGVLNG